MTTNIFHCLSIKMDMLQIKKKQEEAEKALAIYLPKCTKRHPRNECPQEFIYVCGICEENNPTNNFHYFPGLKSTF
jgi:hypothetical protein